MDKHPDCKAVCQQADEYGVWPERSCSPVCVRLKPDAKDQLTNELKASMDALGMDTSNVNTEVVARVREMLQTGSVPPSRYELSQQDRTGVSSPELRPGIFNSPVVHDHSEEPDAADEPSLLEYQIAGLFEKDGASEDHEDVINAFMSLGLSRHMALRIICTIVPAEYPPKPIDMVLHCPKCGFQHIDKATTCDAAACEGGCALPGECLTWRNPPHRSHLCHACGHIWRPADVPTNGVAAVKTKGKDDSPIYHRGGVVKPLDPPAAVGEKATDYGDALHWPFERQS